MSTQIVFRVLALRHRLRQRDRWTRQRLEEHQGRALRLLREHAYARSPFYGRFHRGLADRPLSELPVLSKEMVMERFDELVTDPTVRLADVEAHLATLSGGDELLDGRYRVASTSGSTGRRGLFLWNPGEWATSWPPTTAPLTGPALGQPYPSHEDSGGELDHALAPVGEGRRLG